MSTLALRLARRKRRRRPTRDELIFFGFFIWITVWGVVGLVFLVGNLRDGDGPGSVVNCFGITVSTWWLHQYWWTAREILRRWRG